MLVSADEAQRMVDGHEQQLEGGGDRRTKYVLPIGLIVFGVIALLSLTRSSSQTQSSSTSFRGETSLLLGSDDHQESPTLARSNAVEDCSSIPPWTLGDWRTVLRQCGLFTTVDLVVKGMKDSSARIPDDVIEEFIRPLSLAMPSRGLRIGLNRNTHSRRVFFTDAELKNANSGHCFLTRQDEESSVFQCLPSLVIIGFQRGGTRELYEWLQIHPNAKGYGSQKLNRFNDSRGSETHYFDSLAESVAFHQLQPLQRVDIGDSARLEDTWKSIYLQQSPIFSLPDVLGSRFVFEKTPAYADETDPRVIRRLLPDLKMIISLRDPAARLWSWFWMRCPRGSCSVNSFITDVLEPAEKCGVGSAVVKTEADLQALQSVCMKNQLFPSGFELRAVLLGFYEVYLRRYETAFQGTKASLLVLFLEGLKQEPFRVMREIEEQNHLGAFDYRSTAWLDEKSKLYVVSNTSKALRGKGVRYVRFEDIPSNVSTRVRELYSKSLPSLKAYLLSQKQRSFVQLSEVRPAWFETI